MNEDDKKASSEAGRQLSVFRNAVPLQAKLHEVLKFMDKTEGRICLDVGAANPMMSYYLRKRGGKWHSGITGVDQKETFLELLGDDVHEITGAALPFSDKTFDVVVIFDFLERVEKDSSFIAECHRIMKPDGTLVVNVAHTKKWTATKPLRMLLGTAQRKKGAVRAGYTESELFAVLKHGFDVYQMRSYSRFFVEVTDIFIQALAGKAASAKARGKEKKRAGVSIAGVFYRIAFQLDMLLFFTRGYYLIATAKRRAWRPRNAPVLVDGRSISEAVLSKAAN
jgi:ubiquinone/menaquinone biosynthesis C-methylase UbiE